MSCDGHMLCARSRGISGTPNAYSSASLPHGHRREHGAVRGPSQRQTEGERGESGGKQGPPGRSGFVEVEPGLFVAVAL